MFSHFVRKLRSLVEADVGIIRVGALRWHLTPDGRELFGDTGPSLNSFPQVVVKQNLQRTISRITLPNAVVYLKRCRANTPRAWVRELLRPPKARLEFENAVRLRELGVPTTEPLGWAEVDSRWPGDSFILTREQSNAVPLDVYLEQPLPPAKRREIAEELGHLFARMHDAGVSHPDPHPGNFLYDGEGFALLDVHAVRFCTPMTSQHRTENLVLLNRWFSLRASRTDRHRFWRAYTTGVTNRNAAAREVEVATERSNLRFWANRTDRYLGNNRQFRRVSAGSVRGHAVRDLPSDVMAKWLADPDGVFAMPGVKLVKDSRSSTVAELAPLSPGGRGFGGEGGLIFKRFRLKSRGVALKNLFRRSPALRSWMFGHSLLDRQLPTARPLFVAHRYRFGIPCEGYIAFEKVHDAVELPDAVRSMSRTELRELIDKLARLLRTMHDRRVSHRDLKAPNVLVSGPNRDPVLIDLVGLSLDRCLSKAVRTRDLARLNASFAHSPHISRTDRLRFLRAYIGPTTRRKAVCSWWQAIATATGAKILKNLQSGRPLG